ncbi:trehalose-6-phosphatase [mine drainage metagenome]|uniref:Trehalose-6-phosphatase n=1 Tax=mine drainage metagenome TaxID=410659 RepID=T1BKQ5_9ZZZZ
MNPEDAVPGPGLIRTLSALDSVYLLYVVTGRSLQEITSFLGRDLNIIALHGALTLTSSGIRYNVLNFSHYEKLCDDIFSNREEYLAEFPGLRIYNKQGNVLFHFGLMDPGYKERLFNLVNSLSSRAGMPVYEGKRIIELRIPDINKGIAIRQYSEGKKKLIAGDDRTDEEAFMENPDAITIHVGPGESISRYRIPDFSEMLRFLEQLL